MLAGRVYRLVNGLYLELHAMPALLRCSGGQPASLGAPAPPAHHQSRCAHNFVSDESSARGEHKCGGGVRRNNNWMDF